MAIEFENPNDFKVFPALYTTQLTILNMQEVPGGAENAVFVPGAQAAHPRARRVIPLPAPITMPVYETVVPLTPGRSATLTLVEFPEDRHFRDIDMKKGKWFLFNQKGFFFMDTKWRWDQRRARKRVSAILRGASKTSLMVTANRNVFKHRQSVRSEWRMEFPAEALGASSYNCNITLVHEDAVPYLLASCSYVKEHSEHLFADVTGLTLIYQLCLSKAFNAPSLGHNIPEQFQFSIPVPKQVNAVKKRGLKRSASVAAEAPSHDAAVRASLKRILLNATDATPSEVSRISHARYQTALQAHIAENEDIQKAVVELAKEPGKFQDSLIDSVSGTLCDRLENKLDIMALLKDESLVSDGTFLTMNNSATKYSDVPQNPRMGDLKKFRAAMNEVATQRVGLQTTTDVATGHTRAWFDIKEVLKLQIYSFIADSMPFEQLLRARREGEPPDIDLSLLARLLRWKLSFDGTDCGDKKMLAFYLVPLSLVKSNQSNAVTFPLAMGWGQESQESLSAFVPHLERAIKEIESDGIAITMPDGRIVTFPVQFDISADMASLWLSSGCGGVNSDKNCVFCESTKESRKAVGHALHDLEVPACRRDLKIFGLSVADRVHICTLHAITRVSEKLVKLIAGALYARKTRLGAEIRTVAAQLLTARKLAQKQRDSKRPVSPQVQATVQELSQRLARLRAHLAELGNEDTLASSILEAGIGRKSFTVTVTAAASAQGQQHEYYTVEASTLTGVQSYNLCGNRSERPDPASPGFDSIPFVGVVDKCFGSCGHPLQQFSDVDSLKHGSCYNCNVRNAVIAWSAYIVPMLRATTRTQLNEAFPSGSFNFQWMKRLCHNWGKLLVDTFGSMGSSSVLSTYMHMVVEHAAYLTWKTGPLGYYSQQGVEAAHKLSKAAYGRATARDGGRQAPAQRLDSMVQVMLRVGRILLLRIRVGFIYRPGETNKAWKDRILDDVALSDKAFQLMTKASVNTRRRLRNSFLGKLGPRIPEAAATGHVEWLDHALDGPVGEALVPGAANALGAPPDVNAGAAGVVVDPAAVPVEAILGERAVDGARRNAAHRRRAANVTARAVAVVARRAAVAAAAAAGAGEEKVDDEDSSGEDEPRAADVEERGIEVRGALRISLED